MIDFSHLPILVRHRLGFDLFLVRAREKHGERFIYDRASWRGTNKHVRIMCGLHGWFEQVAGDHVKFSGGCYECAKKEKATRKIWRSWFVFLDRSQKKHGDLYLYDARSWRGMKNKMRIQCPEHGWFEQIPYDHIRLTGCTACGHRQAGLSIRLSRDEIVRRFRETHGDRYSYEHMKYETSKGKVTITCAKHGNFRQIAAEHASGGGCPRCSGRHRWTTAEFIENAKIAHDGKYEYVKSVYKGALSDIIVTCREHGDFVTQPSRHVLRRDGCLRCSPGAPTTVEGFLEKARTRFGDRYDYSLVEYSGVLNPVRIICRSHGVFEQLPKEHLVSAIGCPSCTHIVSNKETAWLDSLDLPSTTRRNTRIKLGGRLRSVDAFDPASNTVYEFWGDWWHGHPDFFRPEDKHPRTKKTYGELYAQTLAKRALIAQAGYRLVEIWEHEYDEMVTKGLALAPPGRHSKRKRLSDKPRRRKSLPPTPSGRKAA